MLETLDKTNRNIAVISEELKTTVLRINNSAAIWKLLNETELPDNLRASVLSIRHATRRADEMVKDLHSIITDVKNGKGSLGAILADTSIARNLDEALLKIQHVGDHAMGLVDELSKLTAGIKEDINSGNGTAHALLKDSALVIKLNNSLSNIEKGTDGFNQNMEALKHNFLLRGYFRKLEKQKRKK